MAFIIIIFFTVTAFSTTAVLIKKNLFFSFYALLLSFSIFLDYLDFFSLFIVVMGMFFLIFNTGGVIIFKKNNVFKFYK